MKFKVSTNSGKTLIFPCSGASDVGELADRVARRMTRSGLGKIYCLAAIGGHVPQFIDDTKEANEIIIIDGCSTGCAKKTLGTIHVQGHEFDLGKIGYEKGASPATGKNINRVVTYIRTKLRQPKL